VIIDDDRLDTARRSTLVSAAEGDALRALTALYGFSWVARYNDPATQRAALRASLYSARGAPAALYSLLRAIYAPVMETATAATLTPAASPTLAHPAITAQSAGAWVEVEGADGARHLYHIAHATEGSATLTPTGSAYHDAPPRTGDAVNVSFRLLPFRLSEPHPSTRGRAGGIARPCKVILTTTDALNPTPPTYLRTDGDARELGEPLGGHVMSFSTPESSRGSQITGPFPLYLPGTDLSATLKSYIDSLLAAGVELVGEVRAPL
jgi:hypothetical protein